MAQEDDSRGGWARQASAKHPDGVGYVRSRVRGTVKQGSGETGEQASRLQTGLVGTGRLLVGHRPNDTRRAERILECIRREACESLALRANEELQAEADRHFVVVGGALPNNRDLTALVRWFDQTWCGLVRGGEGR